MPQIDIYTILAVFLAIGAVYVLGMVLVLPVKLMVRLIINSVIGALALFVINLIGSVFSFSIGINPITALIAGFLGVPGVVLLIFIRLFM